MKIRQVRIRNFRGITSLDWTPVSTVTCIIGPGDSGKTSILDAVEAALSPRWPSWSDSDFAFSDTSKPIEITVTVGELSREALQESRFGLYLRGWSANGLNDEPEKDDEPVVTVRLTVDETLEPAWELVTDRGEPKALNPRDRALFGVVRLGEDADRHLTWGHGSDLARVGRDPSAASRVLTDAYRKAKELVSPESLPSLNAIAESVKKQAIELGAYAGDYTAGLDIQRSSLSALAIHEGGTPLRKSGLGTRRLAILAIQGLAISEGALILIDEIEHGLEPHRVRHALSVLRSNVTGTEKLGQVFLTSHSPTVVVELACDQLSVCRRSPAIVSLHTPALSLQALIRRVPEAFLSRRVVVCEGKTEVGVLRGLRQFWSSRHLDEPPENRGVVFIDGGGKDAVNTACGLASLGYSVGLLRDSDVALTGDEGRRLKDSSVTTWEWEGSLATEERVLMDISDASVQRLLNYLFHLADEKSVLDCAGTALKARAALPASFLEWKTVTVNDGSGARLPRSEEVRLALGAAAKKKNWFKQIEPGQFLGRVLADEFKVSLTSSTAVTLAAVEAWAYD